MIRKCLAVVGVAVVSLLAGAGAAQAYPAPPAPELELQINPADIVIGVTLVPFQASAWLPASDAVFSVSAPGVPGEDIYLEVLASGDSTSGDTSRRSVVVEVSPDGTFTVGVIFPAPGTYTIVTEGLDFDGRPARRSVQLILGAGGGGGGGGLPGTGFTSSGALLAGAGLAALGAGVILLSRRRPASQRESVSLNA